MTDAKDVNQGGKAPNSCARVHCPENGVCNDLGGACKVECLPHHILTVSGAGRMILDCVPAICEENECPSHVLCTSQGCEGVCSEGYGFQMLRANNGSHWMEGICTNNACSRGQCQFPNSKCYEKVPGGATGCKCKAQYVLVTDKGRKPSCVHKGVPLRAKRMLSLLADGENEVLMEFLLADLQWWRSQNRVDAVHVTHVNDFIDGLFQVLSHPALEVGDSIGSRLVGFSSIIAMLTARSKFATTDAFLSQHRELNPYFRAALLSPFNAKLPNSTDLYQFTNASTKENPGTLWHCQALSLVSSGGLLLENGHQNLVSLVASKFVSPLHLSYLDHIKPLTSKMEIAPEWSRAVLLHFLVYFTISYIKPDSSDPRYDEMWKKTVNSVFQRFLLDELPELDDKTASMQLSDGGQPRVLIVSGKWAKDTSVYSNFYHYVRSVAANFQTDMLYVGQSSTVAHAEWFAEVKHLRAHLSYKDFKEIHEWVRDRRYQIILYLSVGMNIETLYLANKRLAPIQVASYGHSVSTFGSKIDYWIGGQETELVFDGDRSPNYSETLLLIPGLGITNKKTMQMTSPRTLDQLYTSSTDVFIINLPWSTYKINRPQIQILQKIQKRSSKKLLFRFFLFGDHAGPFPVIEKALRDYLGSDSVEVLYSEADLTAYQGSEIPYLEMFQKGHIFLDSHPHGGCNTVMDAFFTQTPMVLWEGLRWNNRIGPALFRRAGLGNHSIATTADEYMEKALELIESPSLWEERTKELQKIDIQEAFLRDDEGDYYPGALFYILENHDSIKRNPDVSESNVDVPVIRLEGADLMSRVHKAERSEIMSSKQEL